MRLLFACLPALMAPGFAFAADEKKEKPPLDGKYTCEGVNGDRGGYKATVEITATGDGYSMTWTFPGETYTGVGIWENDRLCVAFAKDLKTGRHFGVMVYQREKDGTLKGKWTAHPAEKKLNWETLTPEKK